MMRRRLSLSFLVRLFIACGMGTVVWLVIGFLLIPRPVYELTFPGLAGNVKFQAWIDGQYLVIENDSNHADTLLDIELRESATGSVIGSHAIPDIPIPFGVMKPDIQPVWHWLITPDVSFSDPELDIKAKSLAPPGSLMELDFLKKTTRIVHTFPPEHKLTLSQDGTTIVEQIPLSVLFSSGLIPNNLFANLFCASLIQTDTSLFKAASEMLDTAIICVRTVPGLTVRSRIILPPPAAGVMPIISPDGKWLVISDTVNDLGKKVFLPIIGRLESFKIFRNGLKIYDTFQNQLVHDLPNEQCYRVADRDTLGFDAVAIARSRSGQFDDLTGTLQTVHLPSGIFLKNADYEFYNKWARPWPSSIAVETAYAWFDYQVEHWNICKVDQQGNVEQLGELQLPDHADSFTSIIPGTSQVLIRGKTKKWNLPRWLAEWTEKNPTLKAWANKEQWFYELFDYASQKSVYRFAIEDRQKVCSISRDAKYLATYKLERTSTWQQKATVSVYALPLQVYSIWWSRWAGIATLVCSYLLLRYFRITREPA